MKKLFKIAGYFFLLVALSYGTKLIIDLSQRVNTLEEKLGGKSKLLWNEKSAVEKVRKSVVRVVGGESEGSGFSVKKGGFILTNFHVIEFEPSPKVILPDNTFETARVIMADKDVDLAVVKIEKDLPVVPLADLKKLEPAEELLAIGFPFGGQLPGESFVAKGSLSARRKSKTAGIEYIETTIVLMPGMSGGPMVNIGGEVVGINTAGISSGGMGIAISVDSIRQKWLEMAKSKDPLKDVQKTVFEPNKNELEAVRAFYNYLKVRKLEKAFGLLSEHFVRGYSFEQWSLGYRPLLDTSIVLSRSDKKIAHRINIKLTTKDLVGDEIVYKYFEGYWDVRKIDGKWLLWHPKIKEVKDPDEAWFIDKDFLEAMEEFSKTHEDWNTYAHDMYQLSLEPGNEDLSLQRLYDMVREKSETTKRPMSTTSNKFGTLTAVNEL